MRELVRTNDAVLISAIEALLKGAQIDHMVVDQNMSVLEGSIGIFPRRILVGEDEFDAARRLLEDAGFGRRASPRWPLNAGTTTSEDAVLGGRLVLRQPLKGHRVGHDAILLAAAVRRVPAISAGRSRRRCRRGRTGARPPGRRSRGYAGRDRSGAGGARARQCCAQRSCRARARRLPRRRSAGRSFRRGGTALRQQPITC